MYFLAALCSGLVFGLGLLISQMADPAKVKGFLDLAGNWDPSLMLVLGMALCVTVPGFLYARRRDTTLLGTALHLPGVSRPDPRTLVAAAIFGTGWGLAGICPGPALVAVGTGAPQAFVFFAAMLAGMLAEDVLFTDPEHRRTI